MGRRLFLLLTMPFVAAACTSAPEALARPDRVPHYELEATFDADGGIDAVVRITLPAEAANADPAFLLGERFEVEFETDAAATFSVVEDYDEPVAATDLVRIDFIEPVHAPVDVEFRYSGPLNQDREGAYTAVTEDQIELRLDMMWFPLYLDLNLQFTLDATFDGVPEAFVAVSQGTIRQQGGTVTVRRTLPDVDIPFVATRGLTKVTGPGVEVYAADFDWIVTDLLRRHAITAAEFLQSWFGSLPDGDVRLVVLPSASGAYARRGYVVMSEARAEVAELGEQNVPEHAPARIVAHEFAHAWWAPSDPLTEHRWLSESIAEYSAMRYLEHRFGLWTAHEWLEKKRESALAAPPLLGHGELDRGSMYRRGPHLLYDLEREIGRAALDEVLARLGRDRPRVTDDFMKVLADVAGDEAAQYFDGTMRSGPGPWRDEAEEAEAADGAAAGAGTGGGADAEN